ncbi:MAG: hypothetical protein LBM21_00090 [Coriobacteriales bacterium]|nr:hypothetical protein [Coriobacteriales bacterium]
MGDNINTAFAMPHPPILVEGVGTQADWDEAAATYKAYEKAAKMVVELEPELLVFSSPHGRLYRDSMHVSRGSAHGDWSGFGRDCGDYNIVYADEFVDALVGLAQSRDIACDTSPDPELDHGVMVPLSFMLNAGLDVDKCRFVRISISFLGDAAHYGFGKCVNEVARELGRKTLFIGSGDLSHKLKNSGPYGFNPEGPKFDALIDEAFTSGDFSGLFGLSDKFRDDAGECGLNSFLMLAGVFDGDGFTSELYSHEGPWGVGYAIARFDRKL